MGVSGLPQSGTGHTALLTGENAAALYGRHFGPWVPVPLRPLMMDQNILSRTRAAGLPCAFANAYPASFLPEVWRRRPAGPPLAAKGAGILDRTEDHLEQGQALSSEIVNSLWRTHLDMPRIPEITPQEAGKNLAEIAGEAALTLFAHYATDTAGHRGGAEAAVRALQRVDAFLEGLLASLPPDTLLVLGSDHGNIEDLTRGHTLNPTFNLVLGPGARSLAEGLKDITDLAGAILGYLQIDGD